jgi:hypothetical protein
MLALEILVILACAGAVLLGLYGARQAEAAGRVVVWLTASVVACLLVIWAAGCASYL